VEYGRRQSQKPDSSPSEWPTKDQRVPISQVFADPVDTSRYAQYGMDELSPVTQQPRLHGSPTHRSPKRLALGVAGGRRQSQPEFQTIKAHSASPVMGRRVSQPLVLRQGPLVTGLVSPSHGSPLPSGDSSPQHASEMRGRRRSIQMAALHQDFYSESEEEASSLDEIEEEGVEYFSSRPDITGSDYETSVTSDEDEEGSIWEDDGVSQPLLSLPESDQRQKPKPPKHSSTIPQIVVTEPFDIGPNPTLQFSLYYDFKRRTLIVHLQKGFNLPARQIDSETCNAFVIVYLLPNRETDRETYESRVIQNTLNPNFDEMLQFPRLKPDVARKQTLVFRIYHQCGPKHNILIGGVLQSLEDVDFHGKTLRNRIIEDVEESQQDTQGRLLIGLTSNPMKGTLEGTVFEANNLTKQDVFGLAGKFHHPHKEIHMASKGLNTAFLCTSTRAHNEG
jgi:hypothetical protein